MEREDTHRQTETQMRREERDKHRKTKGWGERANMQDC